MRVFFSIKAEFGGGPKLSSNREAKFKSGRLSRLRSASRDRAPTDGGVAARDKSRP